MGKHSNLSIVVTGGASGIGAAVCKSLYEQGATPHDGLGSPHTGRQGRPVAQTCPGRQVPL